MVKLGLALEVFRSSPKRWCARRDRGRWSARPGKEFSASAPARAQSPGAGACRRKMCPPGPLQKRVRSTASSSSRISSVRSLGGDAVELGVDGKIFLGGQFGVGSERLRNHADGIAHAVRVLANVVAGHLRRTVGGRRQRGQHADQSGLAGAIGPQQAEEFSLLHVEADVVDGARNRRSAWSARLTSIAFVSASGMIRNGTSDARRAAEAEARRRSCPRTGAALRWEWPL